MDREFLLGGADGTQMTALRLGSDVKTTSGFLCGREREWRKNGGREKGGKKEEERGRQGGGKGGREEREGGKAILKVLARYFACSKLLHFLRLIICNPG